MLQMEKYSSVIVILSLFQEMDIAHHQLLLQPSNYSKNHMFILCSLCKENGYMQQQALQIANFSLDSQLLTQFHKFKH